LLLIRRIIKSFLALARATLLDEAEYEDYCAEGENAGDGGDDGDFGAAGEAFPFLGDGLGDGRVVVAVEFEGGLVAGRDQYPVWS
jgi:hypothetical protein